MPKLFTSGRCNLKRVIVVLALWFSAGATLVLAQGEPVKGGQLNVGLHVQVKSFDPHQAPNQGEVWVIGLVYNRLVGLDADLNVIPDVASSWEQPDSQTLIFTRRDDVYFHNGDRVTAEDVKFSLDRLLDPATASPKRSNYAAIKTIEAPDQQTVTLHLSQPNSALLTQLAGTPASIVSQRAIEEYGDLGQHDGGSGPFLLGSVGADNTLTLERNPNYFVKGLPYLDRVRMLPVTDNQARNTAVRTGDLDMVTFVTTNFINLLREDPNIVIPRGDGASGQFYALFMNNDVPPFNDPNVRQAIAYALDRDLIMQVALMGEGFSLKGGPIPPWHWAGIDPVYDQPDLERARTLLAESDYPAGASFKLRVWAPQDFVIRASLVIQEALAPLGIKVEIDQQGDWVTYRQGIETGEFQATIQGFGGNIDPDQYLRERFSTGGGSIAYVKGYSNSRFDALVAQALTVSGHDERFDLYREAQVLLANDAPAVFLFNMKQTEALRTNVHGFQHLPTLELTSLTTTWIERE